MAPANAPYFDYHRYLASCEWALLKTEIRKRSQGRCERCLDGLYEQTHHITYERAGHEDLEDLAGLCKECHLFLSGHSNRDPRVLIPLNPWKDESGHWRHTLRAEGNAAVQFYCRGDGCLLCNQFKRKMDGLQ